MADLTKIHEEASGAYAILSSLTVSGDAWMPLQLLELNCAAWWNYPLRRKRRRSMADKTIGSLPVASQLDNDSLLVVEQQSQARSIKGELIKKLRKLRLQSQFRRLKKRQKKRSWQNRELTQPKKRQRKQGQARKTRKMPLRQPKAPG